MKTLIQIQDEYIERVNAGMARWAHRKDGGHSQRIRRGARHTAEKQLAKLGYSAEQIDRIIGDARDMATLIRTADE